MGHFADIDRIRRQGLDAEARQFIEYRLACLVHDVADAMDSPREIFPLHEVQLTDLGIMWACRQPVSLGAVLDDVCRVLGVTTPRLARLALGDDNGPEAA